MADLSHSETNEKPEVESRVPIYLAFALIGVIEIAWIVALVFLVGWVIRCVRGW